jgi:hypothetical protein
MAIPFRIAGIAVLLAGCIAARLGAQARAGEMDEYQVKAGFVSGFASFVEWPHSVFSGPIDPLAICVLGASPFGPSLDSMASGRIVEGRALIVRQIPDVRHAGGCHILFISSSEHLRLRAILQWLQDLSVFSVGDTSDFIAEGGIVSLRVENGRVRIDINAEAAQARHLRVSSRLLQLARIVKR